jgi:hypothetical protein
MRYSNPSGVSLLNQTTQITKPKLSMIWVKKIDNNGREHLEAVWTKQD